MRTHERFDGPATMASDRNGWWEVERAKFIRQRVVALSTAGAVVADIGCGRGATLVDEALGSRVIVNVDSHLWPGWKPGGGVHYVVAAAEALPFRDGAFELVGSFDVLEHLADDDAGLREQARIVMADGHIVTAVPADPRLWSAHDEAVGHFRRYRRPTFNELASKSRLSIARETNFFSFLWLPAFLTRQRNQRTTEPGNGTGFASSIVRRAIALCCAGERRLLQRWNIPIGTSLWFEASPKRH